MSQMLLIMGLPGAGKTTFLAALWHVVRLGTVPGAMNLVTLPQSRSYLNQIGNAWESCNEQEHTHAGAEVTVLLLLEDPESKCEVEIAFPDLSGESFDSQWNHRQWSVLYKELAERTNGIILFVHADQSYTALCISDEAALADVLGEGTPPPARTEMPLDSPDKTAAIAELTTDLLKPYDDSFAPRQVKLVDCLQFLISGPLFHESLPVSVIVTAWDRIEAEGMKITPEDWFAQNAPLLSQFLQANAHIFQPEIYGLSATGGDLEKERERLLDEPEPWRRITVTLGNGSHAPNAHDITLPIKRLIRGSNPSSDGK